MVYGDDGGAVDLMTLLLLKGSEASWNQVDLRLDLSNLVPRCPSLKVLHALTLAPDLCELSTPFDSAPDHRIRLAALCMYKARGLVELGEYDEARALYEEYGPEVGASSTVAQCSEWLEGRAEELTPVPVGRPCNCEIEPPKWREGCGCPPAEEPPQPPASSPKLRPPPEPEAACICDPERINCRREVVMRDLDGDGSSKTTVRCTPEGPRPPQKPCICNIFGTECRREVSKRVSPQADPPLDTPENSHFWRTETTEVKCSPTADTP